MPTNSKYIQHSTYAMLAVEDVQHLQQVPVAPNGSVSGLATQPNSIPESCQLKSTPPASTHPLGQRRWPTKGNKQRKFQITSYDMHACHGHTKSAKQHAFVLQMRTKAGCATAPCQTSSLLCSAIRNMIRTCTASTYQWTRTDFVC
jgi:hypothetical protein